MRQLHLFKSSRQRGTAPPPAKEFELHCVFADTLKVSMMPGWRYTHLPFGEKRDPPTAARLKRMGVTPGWPDFIFVGPYRAVFWLELKRKGGTLSDAQRDVMGHLMRCGFGYLCTNDLQDAITTLKDLGIVRAEVQ